MRRCSRSSCGTARSRRAASAPCCPAVRVELDRLVAQWGRFRMGTAFARRHEASLLATTVASLGALYRLLITPVADLLDRARRDAPGRHTAPRAASGPVPRAARRHRLPGRAADHHADARPSPGSAQPARRPGRPAAARSSSPYLTRRPLPSRPRPAPSPRSCPAPASCSARPPPAAGCARNCPARPCCTWPATVSTGPATRCSPPSGSPTGGSTPARSSTSTSAAL